ncbi:DUF4351 domain-containing protein [Dapis sp. BLCC M229]|uniref:DUF4351 domain-containing protein n=1 Tax=Dapis sp. BLCC M229 TaxID=3400188 RepID=UPI003CF4E5A7
MKESVIYKDIFQTGFERGLKQGIAKIIILFLTHCLGNIPEEIEAKIRSLSISKLDELADAQLDFTSLDDVMNWLSEY